MNIKTKIAALLLGATLAVSCTESLDTIEQGNSELDWSRTSTITLDRVAMAPSTKATDPLMKVGQTFRLYAIDPKTKDIIATRTYSIATTDGVPVIDATQEKIITLPFGVVDVFLVGPVKATLNGTEHEIAGPDKVTPMRGVDLISSKTRVIVKGKETDITPTPLQHRMVKLELAVSMEKDDFPNPGDKSSYKNAYMTDVKHWVGVDNVATTGAWVFDDGGGSVTGTALSNCFYTYTIGNTGEQNLKLTDEGIANADDGGVTGTAYSAYDYVFPTAATQPKLSVTYGYTFREETGRDVPAHEMSGKTAAKLNWAAGTYVKLHTTLTPSIVMTVRTQIMKWDEGGTTPVEPPTNNDLIFWYSGEDAPELIDGKMCWRDRSGNGNHAVLSGSMTYDAVNKCYYAKTATDHFIVPALGKVAEYTLELTAQSVESAMNSAVSFSGTSGIFIHLPYNNEISWYTPIEIKYWYGATDKYIFEQLNSYSFCRNSTTAAIVINGEEKQSWSKPESWIAFDANKLWNNSIKGGVGKQKLYGAKMYKKYMNNVDGLKTLAANHATKLSQLGVTAPLNGTTFDYVKDGLLVDLRGETAPTGTNPNRIWSDLSGRGNSPVLDAGAGQFSDAARGTNFYGGNNSSDYIRFLKSLGTYKELTIEVVTESTKESSMNPLIQFMPVVGSNYLRSGIYWCYPHDVGYVFEAPYTTLDTQRATIKVGNLKYSNQSLSQLSCYRQGDKLYASQNGYSYSTNVRSVPSDKVNQLTNGLICTDGQHIYAIRIYNRALSDMERQHNYLIDKKKYKILP